MDMMNLQAFKSSQNQMVEHIKATWNEERKAAIKEAGYNTFLLKSEECHRPSDDSEPMQ